MSKRFYIHSQHRKAKRELVKFLDTPGWHGICYGVTGSGKTTVLLWVLDNLWSRREIILWRDTIKANEFAALGQFADLKVFVPRGCNVIIDNALSEYEIVEIDNYDDIFNNMDGEKINIISVEPFLLEPVDWLKFWHIFFKELLRRARKHELFVPMAIFIDEFNQLAPSKHLPSIGSGHARMTAWIARNMESLRSEKVRVVGASHGVTKLEKAIRDNITTHFYKRTMGYLDTDVQALRKNEYRIQNLKLNETIVLTVGKFYTKPMLVPHFKVGELSEKLSVHYIGEVEKDWQCDSVFLEKKEEKDEEAMKKVHALVKLIAKNTDVPQQQIADEVGVCQKTISNWLNKKD